MALREVFAFLGFEFDKAKLKQADDGVEALIENVQTLVATFASGVLVSGLNNLAAELDVFDDLSARTGLAVQDLQALGLAFETNGSSAEEMTAALTKLQASLGGLSDGGKEQAEVFKKLGIATKDAAGKAPTLATALPQVFENFSKIESEAEKARVATVLFGRTGVKLLPVLDQGAEGYAKMREQLEAIGGGATEEATKAAGAYRDALARLHYSFFSLKGLIATAVFPRLQQMVEASATAIGRFSAWARQTTIVDNAALALAGTLAVKLGGALAPYLKSGLKFGAIFLAIDEVIGFLQGKDSLIGRLLDKVFGEGTQARVREWVNGVIEAVATFKFQTLREFVEFLRRDIVQALDRAGTKVLAFSRKVGPVVLVLSPVTRAAVALAYAIGQISSAISAMKPGELSEKLTFLAKGFALLNPAVRIGLAMAAAIDGMVRALVNLVNTVEGLPDLGDKLARFIPALRLAKVVGEGAARLALGGDGGGGTSPPADAPARLAAAGVGGYVNPYTSSPVTNRGGDTYAPVITNYTTVQVSAGTPSAQVKEVARAAERGTQRGNRAAKQALSQRGSK